MSAYRDKFGFLLPIRDADKILYRRLAQWEDAEAAIKRHCKGFGVAVQAGANWGYWPLQMSRMFETVYTFEPDAVCFACLVVNTSDAPNVVKFQSALGYDRDLVGLWQDVDTTGNQHIDGPGIYPTLRIDDLNLPECDLIYLDIEGAEEDALKGAESTIKRCKPIVAYERNGQHTIMDDYGYVELDVCHNDRFMAPG